MIPGAFLTIGILLLLCDLSFFRTPRHRGKNDGTNSPAGGRERPHDLFGRLKAEKLGSLPPDLTFFSTVTFPSLGFVFLRFPRTSDLVRVKKWQFPKFRA